MKILHIAPNVFYIDNWGYQDNLLPEYHKRMGHDVTVIVSTKTIKNGQITEGETGDYYLENGVRVVKLPYKEFPGKKLGNILKNTFAYIDVRKYLEEIRPDFIFFHGLQSNAIFDVIKYKKKVNPGCTIVQDNHIDYYNAYDPGGVKSYLLRAYFRFTNRLSIKYVDKVYGVTPWRVTFAEEYMKIPHEKTDLLIMAADDKKIDFENRAAIRKHIRAENMVSDKDFLVVTGGKIDKPKNIHLLMRACKNAENVKLLVFGKLHDDVKEEFEKLLSENDNIIYVGWIDADRVYDYFFAADLVVFPGTHSVLWEQACAAKVPCVFERWEGMLHVNNGGNSDFIDNVTEETLKDKIMQLRFTDKYYEMKKIAESDKTDVFCYSTVAVKSLECAKNK